MGQLWVNAGGEETRTLASPPLALPATDLLLSISPEEDCIGKSGVFGRVLAELNPVNATVELNGT